MPTESRITHTKGQETTREKTQKEDPTGSKEAAQGTIEGTDGGQSHKEKDVKEISQYCRKLLFTLKTFKKNCRRNLSKYYQQK